jgi:uncharacterized protein (TIGR03000 family)
MATFRGHGADGPPDLSGSYSAPVVPPSAADPVPCDSAAADNLAYIQMEAPADAEVWVGMAKMSQTGRLRNFVSPPLPPGKNCFYQVRARWTANGQPVEQTRNGRVRKRKSVRNRIKDI